MTSAIQPAPPAAERLLSNGCDRRVILTALSLGSLPNRSVDRRTCIGFSDALESWASIRLAGENRPASSRNGGRYHGQS